MQNKPLLLVAGASLLIASAVTLAQETTFSKSAQPLADTVSSERPPEPMTNKFCKITQADGTLALGMQFLGGSDGQFPGRGATDGQFPGRGATEGKFPGKGKSFDSGRDPSQSGDAMNARNEAMKTGDANKFSSDMKFPSDMTKDKTGSLGTKGIVDPSFMPKEGTKETEMGAKDAARFQKPAGDDTSASACTAGQFRCASMGNQCATAQQCDAADQAKRGGMASDPSKTSGTPPPSGSGSFGTPPPGGSGGFTPPPGGGGGFTPPPGGGGPVGAQSATYGNIYFRASANGMMPQAPAKDTWATLDECSGNFTRVQGSTGEMGAKQGSGRMSEWGFPGQGQSANKFLSGFPGQDFNPIEGRQGFNQGSEEDEDVRLAEMEARQAEFEEKMEAQRAKQFAKAKSYFLKGGFSKAVKKITAKIAAYEKKGVVIPSSLQPSIDALAGAEEAVANATEDDFMDVQEGLREAIETVNDSMGGLEVLSRYPTIKKSANKFITKLEKDYAAAVKKAGKTFAEALVDDTAEVKGLIDGLKAAITTADDLTKSDEPEEIFSTLDEQLFNSESVDLIKDKIVAIQGLSQYKRLEATLKSDVSAMNRTIATLTRKKLDTSALSEYPKYVTGTLATQAKTLLKKKPFPVEDVQALVEASVALKSKFADESALLEGKELKNDFQKLMPKFEQIDASWMTASAASTQSSAGAGSVAAEQ